MKRYLNFITAALTAVSLTAGMWALAQDTAAATPVTEFDAASLGVHNIAVSKTTKGGQNSFGYAARFLVDGKTSTTAAVENGSKITIDLGRRYPVSYFGLMTASEVGAEFRITMGNSADMSDAAVMLESPAVAADTEYTWQLTQPAAYRYICLESTGTTMLPFNELFVYSDADYNAGIWTMKDTKGTTLKNAVEGKTLKSLSITVANYTGEPADACMVVLMYDDTGKLVAATAKSAELAAGTNTVETDISTLVNGAVPTGYTVKAYLMDTFANGYMYVDIYEG